MQVKYVVLSGIVVLLAASGAWAVVGQAQGFSIGAINSMPWGGGVGSVESSHSVMIGQEQKGATSHGGTLALQKETGVLTQTASASGMRPSLTLQNATTHGLQGQIATSSSQPGQAQGQLMGVGLTTKIAMPHGSGAATSMQGFVGGQTQVLLSPAGMSTESQVLGATQYTAVVGGPHGQPKVENSLNVNLAQGQLTGFTALPK